MSRLTGLALMLILTITMASGIRADGESRPATQAEKDFHVRTLTAFAAAVPGTLPGWELREKTDIKPLRYVGVDSEQYPMMLGYSISWQDSGRLAEYDARVTSAGEAMARRGPDASLEALEKKYNHLAEKIGQAAEKGDYAAAQKLQAEMAQVAQQLQEAQDANNAGVNRVLADQPHDVRVTVFISANEFDRSYTGEWSKEPDLAGNRVYRFENGGDSPRGWEEGTTCVVLGPWQFDDSDGTARLTATPRAGVPHTRVQTIVVAVRAEKERARRMLRTINWSLLKAQLR